jgi:hypothetical protein
MVSHFVAVTQSRIHITLTALARTDLEFCGFRLCDSRPDSRYCCSTQFGSTGSFRVAVNMSASELAQRRPPQGSLCIQPLCVDRAGRETRESRACGARFRLVNPARNPGRKDVVAALDEFLPGRHGPAGICDDVRAN